MAKTLDDTVLDGALDIIKNGATQECLTVAQPTTFATATGTYNLMISPTFTAGTYSGPADDTTGVIGRRLYMPTVSSATVTVSGTANYVSLCGAASVLYAVTTCTPQALVAGNTVTVPPWKIQVGDPT